MHVAVSLLNRGRGSGGVARQHVRALLDAGHRVTLLHPGMRRGVPEADNRNVLIGSGVLPVHEYLPGHDGAQRRVSRMSPDEATARIADYERALERVADVDVYVAHHANLNLVATRRVAARRDLPYVVFIHGTGIEPRHQGGYADEVWEQIAEAVIGAAAVLVTTEYVKDALVKPLLPIPDSRFIVLACGVDTEEFAPGRSGDVLTRYELPERYVICPGALTMLKGPHNVAAATDVYADDAVTIFIGDGELRERLARGLGKRGRLLGFVSNDDKAALINGATLLVAAPEKLEHFGIIYVEALAAGTPVVAYRGGGVDAIVTPDVGVLTRRNSYALGMAVRNLLRDPQRIHSMAYQGRLRALECYEQGVLGRRFVKWLEEVAATPAAGVVGVAGHER
jgi:glycosyltransferase involved in cell wall biosynthesis